MFGFIGSKPPFDQGLHLKILLMPIKVPRTIPYSFNACKKYVEQLECTVNFMNLKYKSHISDEDLSSKLRHAVSVKYTPGFKDLI